jgi:hypothetical protein
MRLAHPYVVFAQVHAAHVFDRWGISYQLIKPPLLDELSQLGKHLLAEQHPMAVLTGTSWGATVDKALTLAAKEQGVPCAAVIEHWDLYRERFSIVTNGLITDQDKFLPDWIWVNDKIACAEAIEAGLPVDLIEVVGQPHLEHQIEVLRGQGTLERNNTIVFISERVRDDFALGSTLYRGFDEFEALDMLINSTDFSKSRILIKLHPQEQADKYNHFLRRGGRVDITQNADNAELIMSSGRIVGMFSMLLLEAALVRNDVISFMPGGNSFLFIGNRLGATLPATTRDELRLLLEGDGTRRGQNDAFVTTFGERFLGSAERMTKAVEKLIT